MYQTVLFDLDGTLTDPGAGITNSVAYALEKYGIHNTDRSQLYKFIGPPLRESFGQFYGFSKEQAEEATAYYREYYKDKGIYENRLYQGIPELLQMLADAGATLLVATSKPEQFACRILDYFSIRKYFTYVAGATMDGSRSKKSEIIEDALRAGISAIFRQRLWSATVNMIYLEPNRRGLHRSGYCLDMAAKRSLWQQEQIILQCSRQRSIRL